MSNERFIISIGCAPIIIMLLFAIGIIIQAYKIGKLEGRIVAIETQLQDAQLITTKDAVKLKKLFNDKS